MEALADYIGKVVHIEGSGKLQFLGYLVDLGEDILVINNGRQYVYLPFTHIHTIRLGSVEDYLEGVLQQDNANDVDNTIDINNGAINYRKILCNAKGLFLECYITGNHTIHGYITQIMDDYFVFYSPVYHTMFISMDHLKYLIPYYPGVTPYSVDEAYLGVEQNQISLANTFEQLLKQIERKFIVMDLGDNPNKIGFFKKMDNGLIQLVTANGEVFHWNLRHIKTVHLP
jgi:hypothetical protein